MHVLHPHNFRRTVHGIAVLSLLVAGCSRTEHRINADQEAYSTIAERNTDPRWAAANYSIDQDPRSRYYDPHDPDCPPMPVDDPASSQYMRCVDGMPGWAYWLDNGVRGSLENPQWRAQLAEYAELADDGSIRLDVESALRLAYMHAPLHQRQLETLYLSSLDVTGERFRLDTQFFGGNAKTWDHNGGLAGAGITFDPRRLDDAGLPIGRNDYVVSGPFEGVERNRLNLSSDIQARRRLATAGEVLVGFANSFVFEFTGGDVNLASSLANFSFVQPLLRGAGRDVALEQLTQAERQLLANLRAYGQFRQGLFTQVVIGELGVTGPQRGFSSTSLQSFSGFGGVSGYLGLLQQAQQIRNTEDNLRLQLRTRDRLEALYDNDLIDIVQVDQFRQSIEVTRANRLDQTNALKLAVDSYMTGTLGLPSDLPVAVDETLVEQFQLIPVEANPILESLFELQSRIGDIGETSDLIARVQLLQGQMAQLPNQEADDAGRTLDQLLRLVESVSRRLEGLPQEIALLRQKEPNYPDSLQGASRTAARRVLEKVQGDTSELQQQLELAAARLEQLVDGLTDDNLESTIQENSDFFSGVLSLCGGVVLVQYDARDISQEPQQVLERAVRSIASVQGLFDAAQQDLIRMEEIAPDRERMMRDDEKKTFRRDRQRLRERILELRSGEVGFDVSVATLKQLRDEFEPDSKAKTVRALTAWIQSYLQVVERLTLVPAQARLEVITVDNVDLDEERAFQIALTNRLDFMNGRAALVDRWRAIQVAADALQSDLTITGSGDVGTGRNNPTDFRAATSNLRLGLEFDAPLARLLERNGYRETLIEYQRSRRSLIQSRDSLQKGLRALLRTLEQRRLQLEIQRRAVSIALRRVDQTQLSLQTPPPQGQPGVRPQINPTTAINLLGAQSSLQSSQNNFLAAWLNYYAARLRLYRELGVMQLDPTGKWVETAIDFGSPDESEPPVEEPPLPPAVPTGVLNETLDTAPANDDLQATPVSVTRTARDSGSAISKGSTRSQRDPVGGGDQVDAEQRARLKALKRRRRQLKIEQLEAELRDPGEK